MSVPDGYYVSVNAFYTAYSFVKCRSLYGSTTSCKNCSGPGTTSCTMAMDGFYLDVNTAKKCNSSCVTCTDGQSC